MAGLDKHICRKIHVRECKDYDASHLIGAPFPVTLTGGVLEKHCEECNAKAGHILKNPRQLTRMVAVARACDDMKLNGSEVRFLRKSINLKAKELAEKLDIDPAHLSRIENGHLAISVVLEKLVRSAVCLSFLDEARIVGMDGSSILSMNIPSVVCSSRIFSLDLRLVEQNNVLHVVGGERSATVSSKSWKDDCEPKIAI
ncbi:helix-turn-helix transcriptional regulator [uncultured Tateyamaria sp.]|uniref:helix-turn-helix domain-containing protein n=1 Tax=uncultured Tateyamaria sp. TaxID=455651 RepID=UPI0026366881|nr:helix-turn-helix transcriptional regulator [uncultured Tateyamaria sp.]